MPTDYEKEYSVYRDLAKKAAGGDAQAMKDKAKAFAEVRAIEREAAKQGTILASGKNYTREMSEDGDGEIPTKQSLQQEYIRKFDGKKTVMLNGKEQTLRQYHKKRLLGGK